MLRRLFLIAGILTLCIASVSQDIQHEVTVTLKLVQVFVTDKEGNPVKDLTKEDFQLFVNGKPVAITDFEPHFFEYRTTEKQERKISEAKPKLQDKFNRKFFFIFDYLENDIAGILQSKRAFNHYINNQLLPEDEVSILSYSTAEGFVVHEYLTNDRDRLKRTIECLKRIPGFRSLDMNDWFGRILYREYFIQDMKDLARAFRIIPGNKNIIFFSHGILFHPSYKEIQSNYEEMCDDMANAGASIFTIDTAGLRGERDKLWMKRPMKMLAKETGGQYFSSVEYFETFNSSIQNLTNNYYVLGFYISESSDGRFNRLKVKVDRKGCHVHTQGGYYNAKPFHEFNDIEKRIHLVDLAFTDSASSQTQRTIPLIVSPIQSDNGASLELFAELSRGELKEVFSAKTEVIIFAVDKENTIYESKLNAFNFASLEEDSVNLDMTFELPPGEYICRFILRNTKTGEGAVGASDTIILKNEIQTIRILMRFFEIRR